MDLTGKRCGFKTLETELPFQACEERDSFTEHDRHDVQLDLVHEIEREALPRYAAAQEAHPSLAGVASSTPHSLFNVVHHESEGGAVVLYRLALAMCHQI